MIDRPVQCSKLKLVEVFEDIGLKFKASEIVQEYRLVEVSDTPNKTSDFVLLFLDDMLRIVTTLWEKDKQKAIGFIFDLGFNAGYSRAEEVNQVLKPVRQSTCFFDRVKAFFESLP
jgi:hypothetical protein